MAELTIDQIVEAIEKMTILEVNQLVSKIEEKFGVSAAMPVAVGPAAGGGAAAAAPAAEEQTEFTVTLKGFAVFVPNVRGSTGYGLSYMKRVDHDWGGKDRLDHVHAMTKVLPLDARIDVSRAGVVGRSYGGYMTLTLAARHRRLWKAAVDMFWPYDLLSFMERIPETWKPYFRIAVGDPVKDKDLLIERSPATYMDDVACPLLVIQGRNDPRVAEPESRDVVERLRGAGKQVDYLVFEDEGHDVLKFPNKVRCYNAITDFFKQHLQP